MINTTRMRELATARGHNISIHTIKTALHRGFIAGGVKVSLSGRATTPNGGIWLAPEPNYLAWLDRYIPRDQPKGKQPL
jgi:hypothetical protein